MCDHETDGVWYWKGKPWELSYDNAHPVAQELLADDYFWSSEEYAPFGNSNGIETLYFFIEWRKTNLSTSVKRGFLHKRFKEERLFSRFLDLGFEATFPSKEWIGFHYTNCDEIIIAASLSQLILEGKIEIELLDLAFDALERQQRDDAIMEWADPDKRKQGMKLIADALGKYKIRYLS